MRKFWLGVAAAGIAAGAMPTPVAANTIEPPEVGACYTFTAKQKEADYWAGGTQVPCTEPHDTEILLVQPLTGAAVNGNLTVKYRQAIWRCLDFKMGQGPLTRLNGNWSYTYFLDVKGSAGVTTPAFVCGAAMLSPRKWQSIKTSVPYSKAKSTGGICKRDIGARWSPGPVPCSKNRDVYQLREFVLLDKTFTAKYPGAPAVERKTKRLCKVGRKWAINYPLKKDWNGRARVGLCWN